MLTESGDNEVNKVEKIYSKIDVGDEREELEDGT